MDDLTDSGALGPVTAIPAAAWLGGWLVILSIPVWMSQLAALWLLPTLAGAIAWSWGSLRAGRAAVPALVIIWLAFGMASGVQLRLADIANNWDGLQRGIENRAATELNLTLDALVEDGEAATSAVQALLAGDTALPASGSLFAALDRIRSNADFSAVALFDPRGVPIAWAGEQRGSIPVAARLGSRNFVYHEGPLFSYIYFSRAVSGGRMAVASMLLESEMAAQAEEVPLAAQFADRFGLRPQFFLPERARGATVWDWSTDRPILSVSFDALTQQQWWERVVERGRMAVGAAWLLALLLLGVAWYRLRGGAPGVPVAMATAGAVLAPLGDIVASRTLFSPLQFLLPGPGDITLGGLLILLIGAAVWLLTRAGGTLGAGLPLWLRGAAAAAVMPMALVLIERSATSGLLGARLAGGLPLQIATVLLLALPLHLLLRAGPGAATNSRHRRALVAVGVILPVAMGLAILLLWEPGYGWHPWTAALWAVPFAMLAVASQGAPPRWSGLRPWLIAGWISAAVALPHLWVLHSAAELETAERELEMLGTRADPFLDFLLRQFADRAAGFAEQGEDGVNLLYHSWVDSGLAAEGYEAHVTLWSEGRVEAELPLSSLDTLPAEAAALAARPHPESWVRLFTRTESLHYLLAAPLGDGRVVSVAVPPRLELGRTTPLARFLYREDGAERVDDDQSLFLVPVEDAEPGIPVKPGEVQWTRTESGWRSEALANYPSGWMHAHLSIRTAGVPLLLVRGALALTVIFGALLLLWGIARYLCGDLRGIPVDKPHWTRSFQGRLAIALFLFFLLPTAVFGAVAYGAVAREVILSAAGVAQRTLEQAAVPADTGATAIPGDTDTDLLLYREGMLAGSAAPEIMDLGLFHTWLPPAVFLEFASGETTQAQENRRLGRNDYLIAYRRIDQNSVLAAPIPLASEQVTTRREEFRDIALLVSLFGAALSIILSLLVARALSRPISELSRAAAGVGEGNLRVHLPEHRPDEFGGVYRSFNQMVRALRQARSAEVRTARVLAWGEMARQVAHEIKNPLTPIKLSVQHLRRAFADGRTDFARILDTNVDVILQEIDRLGEIARAFSRFGTPDQGAAELEAVDLERAVRETLALYRAGGDNIRFEVRMPTDEELRVVARTGELKEVLVNLLENAREALDGTGAITIAASAVPDGWVEIDIHDSGEGIPAELLSRIFEPHFSTRSSGTGLGLAIVRRMVESWSGTAEAGSEEGGGTTVRLRLRAATRLQ
jgi:signal transduction histidine kinase